MHGRPRRKNRWTLGFPAGSVPQMRPGPLALALALLSPAAVRAAPAAVVDEHTAVRRALARTAVVDIVEGDVDAARATAVELRTWQNPELAYTREQTYGAAG